VHDEGVVADERERDLVRAVQALAAGLGVQSGDPGDGPAATLGAAFLAGEVASASRPAVAAKWRGLATCAPSEVVTNDATPMSIPTTAPAGGSASAGTSSHDKTRQECCDART
jgi:hypothetical protein